MSSKIITSASNPLIKSIVRLKDKRERDQTGLYIIEGYRECLRAQKGGVTFQTFVVSSEHFLGASEADLISSIAKDGSEIIELPKHLFSKISYRDRPDGLLGIAKKNPISLSSFQRKELFVVAESIEKPGNLGSILRSSDAVGASGLIVCDRKTDVYNPNVVRASVGTLFTVPVVEDSSENTLNFLRKNNIQIVATTPDTSLEYTQANLTGPVAIVMGTEQLGLSDFWLKNADIKVRIPMLGVADSLNVASATTLLLYECLRQKRGS